MALHWPFLLPSILIILALSNIKLSLAKIIQFAIIYLVLSLTLIFLILVEVILTYTGGLAGGACCYLLPAAIGARALGVRKRSLEMGLMILLLCGLGVLILLSPFLTFLGVDV